MPDPSLNFGSFILSLAATAAIHFGDRLEPGADALGPVDLIAAGQMIDTGREFGFKVPGDGIVLGQAGRLVSTLDGSEISFAGNSVTDASALCAALGP